MTLVQIATGDDGAFPWAARTGSRTYDDGAFVYYAPAAPPSVVAEILIGGTVVWSSTVSATQHTLDFDVSGLTGPQEIIFRIRRT
jgi:hypothetical protein